MEKMYLFLKDAFNTYTVQKEQNAKVLLRYAFVI